MNVLDKRRTLVRGGVAKVLWKGRSMDRSLVTLSSLIDRCRGLSQRILDRSCIMKMSSCGAERSVSDRAYHWRHRLKGKEIDLNPKNLANEYLDLPETGNAMTAIL